MRVRKDERVLVVTGSALCFSRPLVFRRRPAAEARPESAQNKQKTQSSHCERFKSSGGGQMLTDVEVSIDCRREGCSWHSWQHMEPLDYVLLSALSQQNVDVTCALQKRVLFCFDFGVYAYLSELPVQRTREQLLCRSVANRRHLSTARSLSTQ